MSNGCGCERGVLKYVKPPYAKKFLAACMVHDDDYDKGGTDADRKEADRDLFVNMEKLTMRNSNNPYSIVWFTLIALLYYMSVRLFGRYYFNYWI